MIRVLLADASPYVRQELKRLLERDGEIAVVALAASARFALSKCEGQRPDVVVLANLLGGADAAALRELRNLGVALVALDAETTGTFGAEREAHLVARATELAPRIKAAARGAARRTTTEAPAPRRAAASPTDVRVIAIGASTGGPQALHVILHSLPAELPGLVIVQHMPDRFTGGFAETLDRGSLLRVAEAEDGDLVLPGTALVAPGDRHLELQRTGAELRVRLSRAAPVNHHRPSVDVMFRSVAAQVGRHALGVILTGMGADGAAGLLAMRQAGARTLAQDEASSVIFGMPKEAICAGAAERVVTLERMASEIRAALGVARGRIAVRSSCAGSFPSTADELPPGT